MSALPSRNAASGLRTSRPAAAAAAPLASPTISGRIYGVAGVSAMRASRGVGGCCRAAYQPQAAPMRSPIGYNAPEVGDCPPVAAASTEATTHEGRSACASRASPPSPRRVAIGGKGGGIAKRRAREAALGLQPEPASPRQPVARGCEDDCVWGLSEQTITLARVHLQATARVHGQGHAACCAAPTPQLGAQRPARQVRAVAACACVAIARAEEGAGWRCRQAELRCLPAICHARPRIARACLANSATRKRRQGVQPSRVPTTAAPHRAMSPTCSFSQRPQAVPTVAASSAAPRRAGCIELALA
eukprot:364517-Chlamydomonas_euryale.AAC.4